MDIRTKIIEGGKLPEYKTIGSAGADCYSRIDLVILPREIKVIPLGFSVEIPEGYEMQIRPRSGLSTKAKLAILGTIDSDYRGEVSAIIINLSEDEFIIHSGDRIAQAIVAPVIQATFIPVEELSKTERGEGGFGHTGK